MLLKYLLPIAVGLTACGTETTKTVETKPEPILAEADHCQLFCIKAVNKMSTIIRGHAIELFELSSLTKECKERLTTLEIANNVCKSAIVNLDAMTTDEFVSFCHGPNWVLTTCQ